MALAQSRIRRTPRRVIGIESVGPRARPAHLHGKPGDLRHQDRQQHHEVSIAGEEGFHKSQWSVVSEQCAVGG